MTSQAEVGAWIKSITGTYIDFDGQFGVQCYDLFNAYANKFWGVKFYGFGYPGDAWAGAQLPNGWSRLGGLSQDKMELGDIIIFQTHVGIIVDNQNMVDENGMGHNDAVTLRKISDVVGWTPSHYIGIIRPNLTGGKAPSGTQPLTPQQAFVKMLKSLNYNMTSIFAIMGSIQGESGFDPTIKEGGGNLDFKTAINTGWSHGWGLIQWTPPSKIQAYPEWNKVNLAETQADIIDDFYNPARHKWSNDGAGASLSVIAQYRSSSGWANVDWDEVVNFNFEYNKFITSTANLETKLAYFIVCCERPNFSDALKSYPTRLAAAKTYSTQNWDNLGEYNNVNGGTGSNHNTQDTVKDAIDNDAVMVLLQNHH